MNDRSNRTVICSIAYLDIVDYSKRSGVEQVALKERFNRLIGEVIKDIAQNDRVVIDSGDGLALCFTGDPEDALFVVMNIRDRLRTAENEAMGLTVRIGLNLGPVRLIHDINDHQNVIGDGINVAARVMNFAEPNQIMVSRSYFEVVSRLSPEYMQLFHYAGARTDKHVREHEVYKVGTGKDEPEEAAAPPGPLAVADLPPPAAVATDAAATPAPARKKSWVLGAVAAAIVLAVGVFAAMQFKSGTVASRPRPKPRHTGRRHVANRCRAGRSEVRCRQKRPEGPAHPRERATVTMAGGTGPDLGKAPVAKGGATVADPAKAAIAKGAAPAPEPGKGLPQVAAAATAKKDGPATATDAARKGDVAKADKKGTGTLEFWIQPYGDVYIDGKQVGTSPPLKEFKLPAGTHRIEIHNAGEGFPYNESVEVKADQVLRITKSFR
ncbi:MAG: PEGA domain-containing protein [Betaproteobacteria bacterium]|nr:PEGA domain-containing protein [Betaproteobacteria bacterium]